MWPYIDKLKSEKYYNELTLMVHNFVAVLTELEVRGKAVQNFALQSPHSAGDPVVHLVIECSISTQTLQGARIELFITCLFCTFGSWEFNVWGRLETVVELWEGIPETTEILQVRESENDTRYPV